MVSRADYFTEADIPTQANIFFEMLTIFGGTFLFATIYNDELSAKNLSTLIGFGNRRSMIVLAKAVLTVAMNILMYGLALLVFYLLFVAIGMPPTGDMMNDIFPMVEQTFFRTLIYGMVTSVVVFGTQKATFSVVVYVLLATGFVGSMLGMLFSAGFVVNVVGDLTVFLATPVVNKLVYVTSAMAILSYLIYLAVFCVLSIVAFNKKDLEF
jgi:ABC-type transport system involved in multi-copper enzyme maturation permease subunit